MQLSLQSNQAAHLPYDAEHHQWLDSLPKRAGSSAMILENEAGAVLIVKANYKEHWTFPGGIIDSKETPKEAAIRETLEETGIEVRPTTVEFVAVINRRSDYAQTYQFIFRSPIEASMMNHVSLQVSEIDSFALVTKHQVLSSDREYGKVLMHWAQGTTGYIEQTFGEEDNKPVI